jgi:PAS domain S-box-containing protein
MEQRIKDLINKHAKDKDSAAQLESLFNELKSKKELAESHLSLLENAIKSDYDSILITTLPLEKPGPKIVYVNDGFTKMTGYTREEVLGKTPRILQGEKTDRAVLDKLKKRLKEGQSFFGHTVNYRKDGTEFINQWDIHPLTNKDGEITHWVSYQHDITERKRSEKRIVDTGIEFDKLTEESKKTLVDLDVQGNILTSNKAFRDLAGYDDEELKKLKIWDLFSDRQIENLRNRFDTFKPGDFDNQAFILELVNKKGNKIEVEAKARLLSANGQNIIRMEFQNKSLQKRIMTMLSGRDSDLGALLDQNKDFSYKIIPEAGGKFSLDYATETFSEITGIDTSGLHKVELDDFIHKDDLPKVIHHFKVVLEGKPNTEQFRIRTKEGAYIEIIDYAKPDWDAKNAKVKAIKGASSIEISSESNV